MDHWTCISRDSLLHQLGGFSGRPVLDSHGVVESVTGEALHTTREGRGEQQGLALRTDVAADGTDLRLWRKRMERLI